MGHLVAREGYRHLADRLNRFPQGAPPSERLYQILEILFRPREAELVAQLPIKPFRTATAAAAWGLPLAEATTVLEALASRAILLDLEQDGEPLYLSHRAMAAILGVILKLPREAGPRQRQLRSRYLDRLLREDPHSSRTTTSAPS